MKYIIEGEDWDDDDSVYTRTDNWFTVDIIEAKNTIEAFELLKRSSPTGIVLQEKPFKEVLIEKPYGDEEEREWRRIRLLSA